jgi:CRISPR-associated protein Csm4
MLVYRLQPDGAFHFGVHGIDAEQSAERCPSDTLYAALLVEALRSGHQFFAPPDTHDDQHALSPPMLLSSCYPYAGDILLLPRPQLRLPVSDVEGQRKLFKNLAYVSPTIFRLIVAGEAGSLDPYMHASHGTLMMGGSVWIAHADGTLPKVNGRPVDQFWAIDTHPHVTIDRIRDASTYFQVGQVRFAPGCGLYLLCQERVADAAAGMDTLLQRLGDSGLGGRRSYGLGHFTVERGADLTLPEASQPTRMILLSRYRPSPDELQQQVLGTNASYDLIQVGGWLQTPDPNTATQRRRNVRLLKEGSVIQMRADGHVPLGTICNVAPDHAPFPHPVWRYGLAMGVRIGA